jgi:hypothetical protein
MPGTLIPAGSPTRSRIVCGLRELADYLERNPTVPVHEVGWDLLVFARGATQESGRAEVDQVAAALGVAAAVDTPHDGLYTATKAFGPITYHFIHLNLRRPGLPG